MLRVVAFVVGLVALASCDVGVEPDRMSIRRDTFRRLNADLKSQVAIDDVGSNLNAGENFLAKLQAARADEKASQPKRRFLQKKSSYEKQTDRLAFQFWWARDTTSEFLELKDLLRDRECGASINRKLEAAAGIEAEVQMHDRLVSVVHQIRLNHAERCAPRYAANFTSYIQNLDVTRKQLVESFLDRYIYSVKKVQEDKLLQYREIFEYIKPNTLPSRRLIELTIPRDAWDQMSPALRAETLRDGIYATCEDYSRVLLEQIIKPADMDAKLRADLPADAYEFTNSLEYLRARAGSRLCEATSWSYILRDVAYDPLEEAKKRKRQEELRAKVEKELHAARFKSSGDSDRRRHSSGMIVAIG